jgi:hypothetical protein
MPAAQAALPAKKVAIFVLNVASLTKHRDDRCPRQVQQLLSRLVRIKISASPLSSSAPTPHFANEGAKALFAVGHGLFLQALPGEAWLTRIISRVMSKIRAAPRATPEPATGAEVGQHPRIERQCVGMKDRGGHGGVVQTPMAVPG